MNNLNHESQQEIQKTLGRIAQLDIKITNWVQPEIQEPPIAQAMSERTHKDAEILVKNEQTKSAALYHSQTGKHLNEELSSFLTGYLITVVDNKNLAIPQDKQLFQAFQPTTYSDFSPSTSAIQFIYNGICNWEKQENLSEMQYQQSGIYPLVAFAFADLLQRDLQVCAYVCLHC